MARSKTVVKVQVRNPVTGKLEWRKMVTKLTNASRGTNNSRPYLNEENRLKSEMISEKGRTDRVKRGMLSTDIANVANQAGSAIRSLVGLKPTESTEQTKTNQGPIHGAVTGEIQQLVNGGTTNAGNRRDDDDDSLWVEG